MKNQIKKLVNLVLTVSILISATTLFVPQKRAESASFNKRQQYYVDIMAKIAGDNWEKYGVLPSVCIAQAMVESGCGDYSPARARNNLWGLGPHKSYSSIEAGVYAYMKCINNSYFHTATFKKHFYDQLDTILDHGYCKPRDDYDSQALNAYNKYNLVKYDRAMFKKLAVRKAAEARRQKILAEKRRQQRIAARKARELKERRQRQSEVFILKYDPSIPDNYIGIPKKIVPSGSISLWRDNQMIENTYIYDIIEKGNEKDNIIYINQRWLDGVQTYIQVNEAAKG